MQSQTPLIVSYQKSGHHILDICKQGVKFLRQLKNQKLRIVFNVTHQKPSFFKSNTQHNHKQVQYKNQNLDKIKNQNQLNIDLQAFNHGFISTGNKYQNLYPYSSQQQQYEKNQKKNKFKHQIYFKQSEFQTSQTVSKNLYQNQYQQRFKNSIDNIKATSRREIQKNWLSKKIKQISKGDQDNNIKICGLLTIYKEWIQLSQQKSVIILNAYQQDLEQKNNNQGNFKNSHNYDKPLLSTLGYLCSSTFIYHKQGQIKTSLQQKCSLTKFLSRFKRILDCTNIEQLDNQTKFKTGYAKKPYFLCLLYNCHFDSNHDINHQKQKNYLREKYVYNQKDSELNQAVDTILNYFPQRSSQSININDKQIKINSISKQFFRDVLGRQLLSFQFTGTTLQSLSFQFCEAMNKYNTSLFQNQNSKNFKRSEISKSNIKLQNMFKPIKSVHNINLTKIYNKIIANQRSRVQNLSFQKYQKGVKQIKKQFPLSQHDLLLKHSIFAENIIRQSIEDSKNCMDFTQYIPIYNRLQKKIQNTYRQLLQQNEQKIQSGNISTYEALQSLQLEQVTIDRPQIIEQLFNLHKDKLFLFYEQSIGFQKVSLLMRLAQKHVDEISNVIMDYILKINQKIRQEKLKSDELLYQNDILKEQNSKLVAQNQFQGQILNSYKLKLQNLKISKELQEQQSPKKQNQIIQLYKRIQQLNEEIDNKNIQIDQLYAILESFQGSLQKNKNSNKFKFAKEISNSVKQVNQFLVSFHKTLQEVNRTEERQKQLRKIFNTQKDKFIVQMHRQQKKILDIQCQLNRIARQKHSLQEIIQQGKKGVKVMKGVEQQYKNTINQLEIRSTRMNCLLAQTQENLQIHTKAVKLLVQHIQKGKSQNLLKFVKVLKNQQLKEILKVFKK